MAKENRGKVNYRMEAWMQEAIKDLAQKTNATETQIIIKILSERLASFGYRSPLEALFHDRQLTKKDVIVDKEIGEPSARVVGE